jgi:hypothetical protein
MSSDLVPASDFIRSTNPSFGRRALRRLATLGLIALSGCSTGTPEPAEASAFALKVSAVDTRFRTRDHFMASVEMQLSGEPFARALGRDVSGYVRNYTCQEKVCSPNMYSDPLAAISGDGGGPAERIDLAGFSAAIESYEYSKQPMNNIAFESGAGTSLLYGRVLNPDGASGATALKLTQNWIDRLAGASNATRHVAITDQSPLGWPGLWPTLQPFSSWDPAIHPNHEGGCSLTSDDNPGARSAIGSDVYECDYTTLNLPARQAQVTMTIDPGSSGFSDWKEALWTLNYLQVMHDVREMPVDSVPEGQLGNVGVPGNTTGPGLNPGAYLGSSNIEGFQAGNFLQILDNQADQWLFALNTNDGTSLDGFASLRDALAYGPKSPLRWFPASIGVTESADASGYPRPTHYAIAEPGSHLLDLAGLLGAYASVYALTDLANADVGGSQAARAYFDGDPFPVQNQVPSGAATLHDRALAMARVLVVDIDRLHVDPASGLFADDADVTHGAVTRGKTLSSDVAAYTLLALRTARRALDSQLTLYGNTTPDTAGIPTPLDAFPLADGVSYAQRLDQLIVALAGIVYDKLTTPDGRAYAGWDLARAAPTDRATQLDAHTAAIRGLLVGYLATGAIKYRDRALRVFTRLESAFYDPSARVYRAIAEDRSLQVTFTPRRFGLLQAALRDSYELLAVLPNQKSLRGLIEDRIGRLNKLVLNGWDDRDQDGRIEWPEECAQLGTGPDGQPLGLGGLQMAERTLTGEAGALPEPGPDGERVRATDLEHDCVPEISAVGLPAGLASSITFTLTPLAGASPHTAAEMSLGDAGVTP